MYRIELKDLTDSPSSMPKVDVTLDVQPDLKGCGRIEGFSRVSIVEGQVRFGAASYDLTQENIGQRVDAARWIAANWRDEIIAAVNEQIRERKANAAEEHQLAFAS